MSYALESLKRHRNILKDLQQEHEQKIEQTTDLHHQAIHMGYSRAYKREVDTLNYLIKLLEIEKGERHVV